MTAFKPGVRKRINSFYVTNATILLGNLKPESVDLIFADPPYNLSKSRFVMHFSTSGGKDLSTYKGAWDQFRSLGDYESFVYSWAVESWRVLKPGGSLWVAGTYHNIYIIGSVLQKLGFTIINEVLWHKTDATPNMSRTRLVADHENFIWARKGTRHTFNYEVMKQMAGGKQMRCIWPRGKTAGPRKIHPTQKPEWLLERIVLASSRSGDLVVDPFSGSGTTAIACLRHRRDFLCGDIDREACRAARKRLAAEKRLLRGG
ncbi:MAG: site-specific DNA-methyltransferase [bacterium]|jgi:site-specific DNA-methyltransferase (adenine-specific)|nr:site-specific DNA-methyltransferase [bacterium]